jgi:hypothetical protein
LMVRTRKVADFVREAWTAWLCWDTVVDVFILGDLEDGDDDVVVLALRVDMEVKLRLERGVGLSLDGEIDEDL